MEEILDLSYGASGHPKQKLDILRPQPMPKGKLPVVVFIHGGGWMGGDKQGHGGVEWSPKMVDHGFIVVNINHRLSGDAPFPAAVHDVKAAIRWIRAHAEEYNMDSERIGVWGHSSGGHLTALLATSYDVAELEGEEGWAEYSSHIQAAVPMAAPTDLAQMGGWHDLPRSPESRFLGGPILERHDIAAKANPIQYIRSDAPPMLIIHGENDEMVPVGQADLLYEAYSKNGAFLKIQGADHGFNVGTLWMEQIIPLVAAFFQKVLKGNPDEEQRRQKEFDHHLSQLDQMIKRMTV